MSWSTGKDCAWALHRLRTEDRVDVVGLLTTLNKRRARVSMHGVRETLLDAQAEALGLPVTKIWIPEPYSNAEYETAMTQTIDAARTQGVTGIAFGDLFLEDVRGYRERMLEPTRMTPLFPLWGLDTSTLAHDMVDAGLRAYLTCVDTAQLDTSFLGHVFDAALLESLPDDVDPCGERGEFHSFAFEGPMFESLIPARVGETVERGQFAFVDVIERPP